MLMTFNLWVLYLGIFLLLLVAAFFGDWFYKESSNDVHNGDENSGQSA